MRLTQVRQILEIEKCTSISQAARNLFVSQPALSAVLNEFEAEVGVQLFTRTNSGIYPTENGLEILTAMKNIMKEVTFIENYAAQAETLTGTITMILGPSHDFLKSEIVFRFRSLFPNASLKFLQEDSSNIYTKVSKGFLDFAIVSLDLDSTVFNSTDTLQKQPQKLNAAIVPLNTCRPYAVLSSIHPLCQLQTIHLSDVCSEQLFLGEQYHLEDLLQVTTFSKMPLVKLDWTTVQSLLDQNFGIFLDTSPLTLAQYRDLLPPSYQVRPFVFNGATQTALKTEWPAYFIHKKESHNKLYQWFQKEILQILQSHQLVLQVIPES